MTVGRYLPLLGDTTTQLLFHTTRHLPDTRTDDYDYVLIQCTSSHGHTPVSGGKAHTHHHRWGHTHHTSSSPANNITTYLLPYTHGFTSLTGRPFLLPWNPLELTAFFKFNYPNWGRT